VPKDELPQNAKGHGKVRDSGMPAQDYWENLLDVPLILDRLAVDYRIGKAIEVGCGYGTFTIPTAKRIRGTLHTYDIEQSMVDATLRRAACAGVTNVRASVADVIAHGFGVLAGSVDAVLLFNILHGDEPMPFLEQAKAVLTATGRILAIHWRSDVKTPRGPDLSIRPRPEQIAHWGSGLGLKASTPIELPPWHFGIVLSRT
jgi:SAM-dependent methyltransferase